MQYYLISSSFHKQSSFDASPGAGDWCDHWKQCVWFVPGKGIPISKDEMIHLDAVHNDTSISYNLHAQIPRIEVMYDGFKGGNFQLMLSPERIAIYGDIEWRSAMLTAIRNAVSLSLYLSLSHTPPHTSTHLYLQRTDSIILVF